MPFFSRLECGGNRSGFLCVSSFSTCYCHILTICTHANAHHKIHSFIISNAKWPRPLILSETYVVSNKKWLQPWINDVHGEPIWSYIRNKVARLSMVHSIRYAEYACVCQYALQPWLHRPIDFSCSLRLANIATRSHGARLYPHTHTCTCVIQMKVRSWTWNELKFYVNYIPEMIWSGGQAVVSSCYCSGWSCFSLSLPLCGLSCI